MTNVYSRDFQEIVKREAKEMNIDLRRGIYAGLTGPSYETPAEIHMLRYLGVDAVGMSTVPEAIIARHQGMKIMAISCISNFAAGINEEKINHEEVMETGALVAGTFKTLLKQIIPKLTEVK
jgi:purine-nucleoside phosphorylase